MVTSSRDPWVLLLYRLPREPSRPRLAVWRAIRRLGALQLGDGLVALPHSPRNLEHLQWLAADIVEHAGTAVVWHAQTDSARDHDANMSAMRSAVDDEYRAVLDEVERAMVDDVPPVERRRIVRRARGRLWRITQRDYFRAPTGPLAGAAVDQLASMTEGVAT